MGKCVKLFYDTTETFLDEDKNLQSSFSRTHINITTVRYNISALHTTFTSTLNRDILTKYC